MPTQRTHSGLEYMNEVTALLQSVRTAQPTYGVWEAADFQWWWRKPRSTDSWDQRFWYNENGEPIAAALATDWGGRIGLDVVSLPDSPADVIEHVWQAGLELVEQSEASAIEVMVDDADLLMTDLVDRSGFAPLPDKGVSAWMQSDDRSSATAQPDGYRLVSRAQSVATPHHFMANVGPGVEERLFQTSLYRSELDLTMVQEETGEVAAYGLFWFDPTTSTGFVEPLGTNEGHRRRGLARHVLTSGVARLARAGASRIKINYEASNPASSSLYIGVGFVPTMTTSLWVRPPV